MVSRQDGKCAICGRIPHSVLVVDHDHATGSVRKLLCSACNSGIGLLGESVERLHAAARYLTAHGIAQVV